MKNILSFLVLISFMLSCKAPSNTTNPDSGKPSDEFPNNPADIVLVQLPKSSLDLAKIPEYWNGLTTDTSAGNKLLGEENTKVSSRGLMPLDKYPNSIAYYYEDYQSSLEELDKSPLNFYVLHYGKDIPAYPKLSNCVNFRLELNTNFLSSQTFFPKEKLENFHSKTIYLQLAFEKGKAISIPILEGDKISSNNQIDFVLELAKKDDMSLLSNFIKSSKDLLEKDPTQPALMRFAWEGINSQGQSETIYSESYKFNEKEMIQAHYNLLRIFNKLNE